MSLQLFSDVPNNLFQSCDKTHKECKLSELSLLVAANTIKQIDVAVLSGRLEVALGFTIYK